MKTAVTVRFTGGREGKFEMQFWGGAGAHSEKDDWSSLSGIRSAKRITS